MGFRFIGVVKTATKQFPMDHLSKVVLQNRGDAVALVAKPPEGEHGPADPRDNFNLLAYVWLDRQRRYFIATSHGVSYGSSYVRKRWRQLTDVELDENPEKVELEVPQPLASEVYYNTCGAIDQHNRCRQDDLNLEKKLQTKQWHTRINMSIFGMGVVDTWRLYSICTKTNMTQREFYSQLAERLVDNGWDSGGREMRKRRSVSLGAGSSSSGSSYVSGISHESFGTCGLVSETHISPNKMPKRLKKDGKKVAHQVRCAVCQRHTIHECNTCREGEMKLSSRSFCHPSTGRMCFRQHMMSDHSS